MATIRETVKIIKHCVQCGDAFEAKSKRQALCSDCRNANIKRGQYRTKSILDPSFRRYTSEVNRNLDEIKKDAKKRAKESQQKLTEAAIEAKRLGISYGQYMARCK